MRISCSKRSASISTCMYCHNKSNCCLLYTSNIRELIVYALRQSGFEAEGFEDGSRLMELPAPELVILDIMLPLSLIHI